MDQLIKKWETVRESPYDPNLPLDTEWAVCMNNTNLTFLHLCQDRPQPNFIFFDEGERKCCPCKKDIPSEIVAKGKFFHKLDNIEYRACP